MECNSIDYRIEINVKTSENSNSPTPRPMILIQFKGQKSSEFMRFHVAELSHCIESLQDVLHEMKKQ